VFGKRETTELFIKLKRSLEEVEQYGFDILAQLDRHKTSASAELASCEIATRADELDMTRMQIKSMTFFQPSFAPSKSAGLRIEQDDSRPKNSLG